MRPLSSQGSNHIHPDLISLALLCFLDVFQKK
jgi:hypothetical protein